MKRKFTWLIFLGVVISLCQYAHTHVVESFSIPLHDRTFEEFFIYQVISFQKAQNLYDFNHWIGTNFSENRMVTWENWFSFSILKMYPHKWFGQFLFIVPYRIKLILWIVFVGLLYKLSPKKKIKKNRKKKHKRGDTSKSVASAKKAAGDYGEKLTNDRLSTLPREYHLFPDLYIKSSKTVSRPFQFDHIVVSPYGIFHIDSKHWKGEIGFTDSSVIMNGSVKSGQYYKHPGHQAFLHQEAIWEYVNQHMSVSEDIFVPIVCFTHPKVMLLSECNDFVYTCTLGGLLDIVTSYKKKLLSKDEVDEICRLLKKRLPENKHAN